MRRDKLDPTRRLVGALIGAALALAATGAPAALASAPRWQLSTSSAPTFLAPGGEGQVAIAATNLGDAPVNPVGAPVTLTAELPPGVTATSIASYPFTYVGFLTHYGELQCSLPSASLLSCTWAGPGSLPPYETLEVRVAVKVAHGAHSGEAVDAVIAGGDAPSVAVTQPLTVSETATPFAVNEYKLSPENEDGSVDTQAGSHPFQLTSTIAFNQTLQPAPGGREGPSTPSLAKDLRVELPPGLIGNPTPFPQCTDAEFGTITTGDLNLCPATTALGVASVTLREPLSLGLITIAVPLFNLTPAPGEPARFGFEAYGVPVTFDASVRTGGDYGVTVNVENVSEAGAVLSSRVTFWGVPGDPRHDQSRGWGCLEYFAGACAPIEEQQPSAFLTLPTACGGPLTSTLEADSWARPGSFLPPLEDTIQDGSGEAVEMDGCNQLPFDPSIEVQPEKHSTSTPTGLAVSVHVPQETTLAATGRAESDVKDTTVTLPQGMQVSPAGADGLEACSTEQVGFTGIEGATQTDLFSPDPVACSQAAKVGTVEITTPLLPNPLRGSVYLATQSANPFGSLLALYVIAEDPVSGVLVKLAGMVSPNPTTGQLTSTFENTPQLPFEDLELHFFGGAWAPLSTPTYCGAYTTTASFTPWSGEASVAPSSNFAITSGPGGSTCPNPQPFSPSLTAGSTDIAAGAFAPFTTTVSREDGDQNLSGVQLHLPPGLLGKLSSVHLCGEPQAAEGTCGPESLIGHTVVSVGLGSDPYTVNGGQVFITGPYKGAPYGLSIAEPAKAGPFDLGEGRCDCVVVRAKIEVDRRTSALTITSDSLPTMLQGIPLQIKHVSVTTDRPGFTFNPTNCSPLAVTSTMAGQEGASASQSSPFQVANCATLPFKPTFTALTEGKASKADGASLDVRVTSKGGPQAGGGEANIESVSVDLPKQLPTRDETLQKACVARVFEANPADCPKESDVGTATAVTPVLAHALTGPAYLVSHAGLAFPDLELVLQGEGVTLVLDGRTEIRKSVTSSTFSSVPDAPISSFELKLPTGKYSILGTYLPAKARYDLCGQKLAMPTEITGQNGAVIKQTTKIAIGGCPKHRKAKKEGKASAEPGKGAKK